MTTKIILNVEISSDVYDDDTMELLRMEIRKGFTPFVFDCVENVHVLGGPIDHRKLNIDGGIKTIVGQG
jgi:hypothetical protein